MINEGTPYIFWLYGCNTTGRFLSTDDLIRCDVTLEYVRITSRPVQDIPVHSIRKCDAYSVGGSTFQRHMVRLKLHNGDNPRDIYVFPANPLRPGNERSNGGEVNAFSELINGIINKRSVDIDPNPYYRNIGREQWEGEELDAYTSPWVYYHRYRKKPTLRRAVLQIIVSFIVLVALLMLIALIADNLNL